MAVLVLGMGEIGQAIQRIEQEAQKIVQYTNAGGLCFYGTTLRGKEWGTLEHDVNLTLNLFFQKNNISIKAVQHGLGMISLNKSPNKHWRNKDEILKYKWNLII